MVEDDPDTLESLGGLLRSRGWLPHLAPSVKKALGILHSNSLDAVVADQGLPDGEGNAVLRMAAALQPGARRILYTAHDLPQDRLYRVVRKPETETLLECLP